MEDLTRPATHIFRLLSWGRTLARHGALRGIEGDPSTPTPVRRLARVARFGTFQPRVPDYAAAFQAIGSWLNEGMLGALREPPQHDGSSF